MKTKEFFSKNKFIILDGAMGTMLQQQNIELGHNPESLCITAPDVILNIHKQYIKSGADIIYACTFGANSYKLSGSGFSVDEVISAAVKIAKQAANGTKTKVALDIGPIGQLLEPAGTLKFEDAYDIFAEQVRCGVKAGADLIVIETCTDLYEARAAVLAAKENSSLPVFVTMTFEANMRTFTGVDISSMALTLKGLGVDAIGFNCSLGPKEMLPMAEKLCKITSLPVIVKPNAGLPDPQTGAYNITADEFAAFAEKLINLGVSILGGCCGTTPEFIARIKNLTTKKTPATCSIQKICGVCSATKTVEIDGVRVIGERINPTGKKRFKQALIENDIDYILKQAIQQLDAGADILDVNVGQPEIDEKAMMVRVIKNLQSITNAPLQIDSSNPDVIEAALRVYNGKPIVNSVNGEEKSLAAVLPLVKKYGAAVVGLTLDENGIPPLAEQRFEIAKKIVSRAESLGIPRENVFIDCLTLTASAQQKEAYETLKAVQMVKEGLGVKTVLGVSNISFGLPARELVNQTFLTLAMGNGLDLPIINPNSAAMMSAIDAFNVLSNRDENSVKFIASHGSDVAIKPAADTDIDINYAINRGLEQESRIITEKLLETTEPMKIVNETLIPILDSIGKNFENGTIFLPQLIQSATAAQCAFEVIKTHLANNNETAENRGVIVIATVKGDVHDIGKNIVKVILENYGYKMIDLGKDVEIDEVVRAAKESGAKLVGLSALMTTTIESMRLTIKALRENNVSCKIMVGGAALTEDYAYKIGADFYAKDAAAATDIAKKVYG